MTDFQIALRFVPVKIQKDDFMHLGMDIVQKLDGPVDFLSPIPLSDSEKNLRPSGRPSGYYPEELYGRSLSDPDLPVLMEGPQ